MGFNVHLPSSKMIGNTEFYEVSSIEKVLRDIQDYVLLYVATNLTYPSQDLHAQS